MRLDPGQRVGAYEIVGSLGAGGMGEVYQARDTRLGRLVAIKFVSDEFAANRTASERLVREPMSDTPACERDAERATRKARPLPGPCVLVRQHPADVMHQARDLLHLLVIDALGPVVLRMVVGMKAGVEPQRRHSVL